MNIKFEYAALEPQALVFYRNANRGGRQIKSLAISVRTYISVLLQIHFECRQVTSVRNTPNCPTLDLDYMSNSIQNRSRGQKRQQYRTHERNMSDPYINTISDGYSRPVSHILGHLKRPFLIIQKAVLTYLGHSAEIPTTCQIGGRQLLQQIDGEQTVSPGCYVSIKALRCQSYPVGTFDVLHGINHLPKTKTQKLPLAFLVSVSNIDKSLLGVPHLYTTNTASTFGH